MRRGLIIVLVVLACRAPEPLPPDPQCFPNMATGGGTAGGNSGNEIFRLGTEQRVQMQVAKAFICDGGEPVASAVETKVFGPQNTEIVHSNSGPATGTSDYSTQLSFTPDAAGPYHLVATFQPGLGVAQVDMVLAVDHAGHEPGPGMRLPKSAVQGCTDFSLTKNDAILCAHSNEVWVFRGGQQVQTLPFDTYAVAGNTVWLTRGALLYRYTDTDGGVLASGAQVVAPEAPLTVFGGEDDVTYLSNTRARQFALENGSLVEKQTWSYPQLVGPLLGMRSGAGLVVASPSTICRGMAQPLTCESAEGQPTWFADDGVWVYRDFRALQRVTPPQRLTLSVFQGPPKVSRFAGNRPMLVYPHGRMYSLSADAEPVFIEWTARSASNLQPLEVHSDWALFEHAATGELSFVR